MILVSFLPLCFPRMGIAWPPCCLGLASFSTLLRVYFFPTLFGYVPRHRLRRRWETGDYLLRKAIPMLFTQGIYRPKYLLT